MQPPQGDYASSPYYYHHQDPNEINSASAPPISSSNFPNYYSPDPPPVPYSFPHLQPSPQYYPPPPSEYGQNSNYVSPSYESIYSGGAGYGQSSNLIAPNYENFGVQGQAGNLRQQSYEPSQYDLDGIYAYRGGSNVVEPYGGVSRSENLNKAFAFDDYGRPLNVTASGGNEEMRVERAVPESGNSDSRQDLMSGVQKFRVSLLAEGAGPNMDVLCQIGLDGIRMLEPATGRTLKIYPLETVTRWEVLDYIIFAFWSKSSIDIEPKRIRLKSNSYTTNTILDAVTAASIQFKEMVTNSKPSDTFKASEQQNEKKTGLPDWMNLIKARNEEKDYWVPDEAVTKCTSCSSDFSAFNRKHHCRNCGDIFCDKCTQGRIALTADEQAQPVRVCDRCLAEVTQRLSNSSGATSKVSGLQSHEDLAKKLQEEMDRKRQTSTGFRTDESKTQMREVACPTCTVHLKVQVPTSGSKTVECGVCQNPFLVNAE